MSGITNTNRIDIVNIGLILFACLMAFIVPFELFLFAYGVLGPLHYLTEISWLHDKNYFATDKRDVILLVVVSLILTIVDLKVYIPFVKELDFGEPKAVSTFLNQIIFIAFGSSLFFALIKKRVYKIVGVLIIILMSLVVENFAIFFSVFLPTLVHVFLFTWLFMLYGSLKTKSKLGYLSVVLMAVIPFLLFYAFPNKQFIPISDYGRSTYGPFEQLNVEILRLFGVQFHSIDNVKTEIFNSRLGIAIMRFIAFAYTYHYLNWFSKTKVIGWHDIPRSRAIFIVLLWIVSLVLYGVDYSLGFKWLFLLSFMHVMLEFPLNYISFVGIFKAFTGSGVKAVSK